jgi:8-oxo-dGTP diphosphatase
VEAGGLLGTFSKVNRWVNEAGTHRIEGHHIGFLYRVVLTDPAAQIKRDPDGLDSLGAVWALLGSLTPETASPLAMRAL